MFIEGQQIGIYTLVRKLGRGGFGEVWLAERRSQFVTTLFALKFPHNEQVDLEAVRHEAQLWAQANGHPNVLPIIEANIYDGQVAIISEFAPDGSLEQLLAERPLLPQSEAVELTVGILRGLEFLHSRNIIHRDIKPANVLLQGETPRLTDFGISRVMKDASLSITIAGTPKYMAPEAFDGKRNVQTDIWSVGVMLYLMLKGSLPFPQEETTELLGAIVFREPEALPDSVPENLRNIVRKSLAKQPLSRYQTAREMREDLQKALIGISHPTFAPTEIFRRPPLETPDIPTVQNEIPPTVQIETPPDREPPPTSTEQLTEQFTRPAIEPNLPPGAPSVVTQIQTPPENDTIQRGALPGQLQNKSPNRRHFSYLAVIGIVGVLFLSIAAFGIYKFMYPQPVNTGKILVPFLKGGKFGFKDYDTNKFEIAPKYDQAFCFQDGIAPVGSGGKWGFVDTTGKEFVPLKYDQVAPFEDKFARVVMNKKVGLIDTSGTEIVPPKYDAIDYSSDGLIIFVVDSKFGVLDSRGKEIVPPKYDGISQFHNGVAVASSGGKYGLMDRGGKEIIPLKYQTLIPSKSDLIAALMDDAWGYIDRSDKTVIPFKYDLAFPFSEDLAAVCSDKLPARKCGYIDKSGNEAIPLKYDGAGSFREGVAVVELNGKYGVIDKTGKEIAAPKYDLINTFDRRGAGFKLGDKWGLLDNTGVERIPPKYDYLTVVYFNLVYVSRGDKQFYADFSGKEYYEP